VSSSKFVTQNLPTQVSGLGSDRVINVLARMTRMIVAILAFPLLFLTACSGARPIPRR
jgi:hypothetical protein